MAPGLLRRLLANSVFRQPEPQEEPPFLTARLSRLILLNYEADPALLTPSLPAHTELDLYEHRTFAGLFGKQPDSSFAAAARRLPCTGATPVRRRIFRNLQIHLDIAPYN